MKIVAWNMQQKTSNWDLLRPTQHSDASPGREWRDVEDADICLLTEAPPAPPDIPTIGQGRTEGLEVALGPEWPVDRPWSTMVASPPRRSGGPHPMTEITDARVDRYYGKQLPFGPSRLGTWVAVSVDVDGVPVTAISVYGLMDEKSDASVHRALSEMSPIFDHPTYGKNLLLGGDLNILANPRPNDPVRDRHGLVLARIKAYGLIDCRTPMWTKRIPGSSAKYQDDYLFASRRLAERLEDCRALRFSATSPSDHAPVVATFDM
jgi:endonuclease/exonuclease/phosphatase family metal-dependent hydrolase